MTITDVELARAELDRTMHRMNELTDTVQRLEDIVHQSTNRINWLNVQIDRLRLSLIDMHGGVL